MSLETSEVLARFEADFAKQKPLVDAVAGDAYEPLLTGGGRTALPVLAAIDLRWCWAREQRAPNPRDIDVSAALLAIAGIKQEPVVAEMPITGKKYSYCKEAEDRFLDVYRQVFGSHHNTQQRVTVYHTEQGSPVLLEKSLTRNALSLAPLSIDGLYIPPGSLIGVDQFYFHESDPAAVVSNDVEYRARILVRGGVAAIPLRLTPWAHDEPIKRATFAVTNRYDGTNAVSDHEVVQFARYDLDDFRFAAQRIMQLCGASSRLHVANNLQEVI